MLTGSLNKFENGFLGWSGKVGGAGGVYTIRGKATMNIEDFEASR